MANRRTASPLWVFVSLALGLASIVCLICVSEADELSSLKPSKAVAQESPDWVFGGVAGPEGTYFLLDVNEAILRYSKDGELLGRVPPAAAIAKDYYPKALERIPGGYLLEYDTAKFVRLGEDFEPTGRSPYLDLSNDISNGYRTLASAFQWTYVQGHQLLVFGDVHVNASRWEARFVRVPFEGPQNFKVLDSPAIPRNLREQYLVGYKYLLTAMDGNAFCLLSDESGQRGVLGKVEKPGTAEEVRRVEGLEDLGQLPRLADKSFRSVTAFFSYLDQEATIGGFFGTDDLFGVVTREASFWKLEVLGTDDEGPSLVPTDFKSNAKQLVVIPNPAEEVVHVVEKGPVEAFARQKIGKSESVSYARLSVEADRTTRGLDKGQAP